jgi:drug/metabolite transporter (DMT)-like permease
MGWFFIALVAPAAWGISNQIDKYLLSKHFVGKSPAVLVIFSSLVGLLIAPLIWLFNGGVVQVDWFSAFIFSVSGMLYVIAVIPYLHALENDDASIVVPMFQVIPVLSYLFGYFFFNEVLSTQQILASILIILGAVGIASNFTRRKIHVKGKVLLLMLIASVMFSLDTVLFKAVGVQSDFWTGAFWKYIGFAVPSLFFLVFIKKYRNDFFATLKATKARILGVNLVNELTTTVGVLAMNFAVLLAPLALVWAVNGFQPVFVFVYGLVLTTLFPHIIKEDIGKYTVIRKVAFLALMLLGTYLLHV